MKSNVEGQSVEIPWSTGQVLYQNLAPNTEPTKEDGQTLGPGRWCLSPRSTVPFVEIAVARFGIRTLSWGEVLEVPEKSHGAMKNASFHGGDAIMTAVGTHASAPQRPACVTIPADVKLDETGTFYITRKVDARTARRIYLVNAGGTAPDAPGFFAVNVTHQAPARSDAFAPGTGAATSAQGLTEAHLVTFFAHMIPMGIGAGDILDTLGRSLAELRPMAFRDLLFASWLKVEGDNNSWTTTSDTFFVLEY